MTNTTPTGGVPLNPQERVTLAAALRAAGLEPAAVSRWLDCDRCEPLLQHASSILDWVTEIGDATAAADWYDTSVTRDSAREWAAAGYSPIEADLVSTEIVMLALSAEGPGMLDERHWIASRLPGAWIVAALQAGIHDAQAARELFDLARSCSDGPGQTPTTP
jgi:hypothetical protein